MADVKISGLPASTVPLAGTEVLPIVQGGATKQVSVTNLTAGKFITASSVSIGNTTDPGATNLSVTGSATIQTLTVGKGASAIATNSAVGYQALNAVTTGNTNVAFGYQAANKITTAQSCVAVGHIALASATTGASCVAVGQAALNLNVDGSNNTAVGCGLTGASYGPLGQNVSGNNNTAIGTGTLIATTVSNGTAVGNNAGAGVTTGGNNSLFGADAGKNITSGGTNTCLGYQAGTDAVVNLTTQSNYVVVGNNTTANANVKVAWTVTSDARDKTNFASVPHSLDFVKQLKPTAYVYRKDRDIEEPAEDARVRYGFLAQDILALEGSNSVIIDDRDIDNLKFNESSLIPVLVNALKELNDKFDAYVALHP